MKRENGNRSDVPESTSIKNKNKEHNAQYSKRPGTSQNTTNPNRGLNEDEQKRKTNQDEEDEITNVHEESAGEGGRTGNESLSEQEQMQREMEKKRKDDKR